MGRTWELELGLRHGAPANGRYGDVIARRRPANERASDRERESVVERLRRHAVAGRLDADELAARAEDAYKARTLGELVHVLRDLPDERAFAVRGTARRRRRAWHLPALGTASAAGATVVVAIIDGGFRGPVDGVAAVPFWATVASGALLTVRILSARVRASTQLRTRKST